MEHSSHCTPSRRHFLWHLGGGIGGVALSWLLGEGGTLADAPKPRPELNGYIDAMDRAAKQEVDDEARSRAGEWISWARQYVELVDPLNKELAMPDDPEPTDEDLRPYLPTRRGLLGY